MTEREYVATLLDMVDRGVITQAEMDDLHDRFVAGELEQYLPLPVEENDSDEYLLLLFLALWGNRNDRPRQIVRDRARNRFREAFSQDIIKLSSVADFHVWQKSTWQTIRDYTYNQWFAGNGTQEQPDDALQRNMSEEVLIFGRYANDVGARQAVNRPLSPEYVVNRSRSYGRLGWAAWFMGNEAGANNDVGIVYQYIPVDDRRTCRACSNARGYYLSGQGPYPGTICYGGWACRCTRYPIYDMDIYNRLIGGE